MARHHDDRGIVSPAPSSRHAPDTRSFTEQRDLLGRGPAAFYVVEHDGPSGPSQLRFLSPQVLDLTGYPAEEFMADPDLERRIVLESDRRQRADAERRHLAVGEPLLVEYRIRTREGSVVWVRDEAARLETDPEGRLFSHGLLIDVTRQKRLEARLAIQAEILELTARNAPLAETLEALVALVDAEIPGVSASVLLAEDGVLAPATNGRLSDAYVSVLEDGIPIQDGAGTCGSAAALGSLVVSADISSDPHWLPFPTYLDAALEAGYRSCWSTPITAADGTVLDPSGRILFTNDALIESAGWKGRLTGRDWFKVFIPKEDREAAAARFRLGIEQGRIEPRVENEILTKAGERRRFVWHHSLLRDRGGRVTGVAAIGEDATERLRLEAQLRESQKQEAIGQMAGGIAHDFNDLLTAITGYADLLLEEVGEGSAGAEEIGEIRRASERATALTRQLLAFARRQPLETKVVDLALVVAQIEPLLRRVIGEDIELTTDLSPEAFVLVDPAQIEQVIVNLAVSARDAMPAGGRLSMEVRVQRERRRRDRSVAIGPTRSPATRCSCGSWTPGTGWTRTRKLMPSSRSSRPRAPVRAPDSASRWSTGVLGGARRAYLAG